MQLGCQGTVVTIATLPPQREQKPQHPHLQTKGGGVMAGAPPRPPGWRSVSRGFYSAPARPPSGWGLWDGGASPGGEGFLWLRGRGPGTCPSCVLPRRPCTLVSPPAIRAGDGCSSCPVHRDLPRAMASGQASPVLPGRALGTRSEAVGVTDTGFSGNSRGQEAGEPCPGPDLPLRSWPALDTLLASLGLSFPVWQGTSLPCLTP